MGNGVGEEFHVLPGVLLLLAGGGKSGGEPAFHATDLLLRAILAEAPGPQQLVKQTTEYRGILVHQVSPGSSGR